MKVLEEPCDTSVSYKCGAWQELGVTKECMKRDEISRRSKVIQMTDK